MVVTRVNLGATNQNDFRTCIAIETIDQSQLRKIGFRPQKNHPVHPECQATAAEVLQRPLTSTGPSHPQSSHLQQNFTISACSTSLRNPSLHPTPLPPSVRNTNWTNEIICIGTQVSRAHSPPDQPPETSIQHPEHRT